MSLSSVIIVTNELLVQRFRNMVVDDLPYVDDSWVISRTNL